MHVTIRLFVIVLSLESSQGKKVAIRLDYTPVALRAFCWKQFHLRLRYTVSQARSRKVAFWVIVTWLTDFIIQLSYTVGIPIF